MTGIANTASSSTDGTRDDVDPGLEEAIGSVSTALAEGVDVGTRVIPLKSVTATRIGPDKALVVAEFRYTFLNAPSAPGDAEYTDIQYGVTDMRVPVYRTTNDTDGSDAGFDSDGLPAGKIEGCAFYTYTPAGGSAGVYYDGRPIATMFPKTAVQITVMGIDANPPSVAYVNANRKLNGGNVTIGGITFAAGTLRLDGLRSRRIVQYASDGTQTYRYVYQATYTAAENFKGMRIEDIAPNADGFLDDADVTRRRAFITYNEVLHPTYGSTFPVPTT